MPRWITPELWPDWWPATAGSLSRTVTPSPRRAVGVLASPADGGRQARWLGGRAGDLRRAAPGLAAVHHRQRRAADRHLPAPADLHPRHGPGRVRDLLADAVARRVADDPVPARPGRRPAALPLRPRVEARRRAVLDAHG